MSVTICRSGTPKAGVDRGQPTNTNVTTKVWPHSKLRVTEADELGIIGRGQCFEGPQTRTGLAVHGKRHEPRETQRAVNTAHDDAVEPRAERSDRGARKLAATRGSQMRRDVQAGTASANCAPRRNRECDTSDDPACGIEAFHFVQGTNFLIRGCAVHRGTCDPF